MSDFDNTTDAAALLEGNGGQKAAPDSDAGTKASTETVGKLDLNAKSVPPATPAKKVLSGEAPRTAAPPVTNPIDEGDKPETIGEPDKTVVLMAKADEARIAIKEISEPLDDLERQRAAIDAVIEEKKATIVKLETVVTECTAQISDADMVKRIQKQTQERLTREAAAMKKVAEQMGVAGIKTHASALDAALAAGAKRSAVIVNGQPYVAPHPRSAEGIRNYGNWVHNGAQRPA